MDAPCWTRPADVDHQVVTCPNCGQAMSWREYLRHGPDCPATDEEEAA